MSKMFVSFWVLMLSYKERYFNSITKMGIAMMMIKETSWSKRIDT